jgi:hypothetical protein
MGVLAVFVASSNRWIAAAVAVVIMTMLVGVVLPGIWSRDPARRHDARAMTRELRRWIRPGADKAE